MELTTWTVHLTWAGPTDQADVALAQLIRSTAGDSVTQRNGFVEVVFAVNGETLGSATEAMVRRLPDDQSTPAGWTLAGAHLRRGVSRAVDSTVEPIPPLVGISESAQILGVSRQRAHTLAGSPDFPPPIASLASGPVFLEAAVRAYANTRRRTSGRPTASFNNTVLPPRAARNQVTR